MSVVQGFLSRIQYYLEKGIILSLSSSRKENKLSQFIDKIYELMNYSDTSFICMVVYFDRLIFRHHNLINEFNINKLIFISGVLAIKMQEDNSAKNSYFAKISGITSHEMNELEIDFLEWIDYSLIVEKEEYEVYHAGLNRAV